ncbi:MAG: hypothetical protein R6V27_14105 [Balneolaceae bacterium]
METTTIMATEVEMGIKTNSINERLQFRRYLLGLTALFLVVIAAPDELYAQTKVTFQVNLTHLLDGKEFNPETDKVELIGNRHPLSSTSPVDMNRDDENPNLFTRTVDFPAGMTNTRVEYQFRVLHNFRYHNEDIPRTLQVSDENQTLDSLYFNSYAW